MSEIKDVVYVFNSNLFPWMNNVYWNEFKKKTFDSCMIKKGVEWVKKNKNGTQTRTQNPESMIAKAGQICVQD